MPSSYVIGEDFEAFIKAQIQQGRYASASEVIRDGLRALEEREKFRAMKLEALRAEIQRGADSGSGIPASTRCWRAMICSTPMTNPAACSANTPPTPSRACDLPSRFESANWRSPRNRP